MTKGDTDAWQNWSSSVVILSLKKKPQFPESGKEFGSFSFLLKHLFYALDFTAIVCLEKVGNSTRIIDYTTVQLGKIQLVQEMEFSQLHVLNPSALSAMTISSVFF